MAGYLCILGGIILVAGTFFIYDSILSISLTVLVVIPLLIIPILYTYSIGVMLINRIAISIKTNPIVSDILSALRSYHERSVKQWEIIV